jgi:HSP20 family protein
MGNSNRQAALLSVIRSVKPSDRLWNPAADVYTSDGGWLVKVDVAGICHDELTIKIEDSLLRISGCRRDTVYREGFRCQQMEITYSRFEKTIQFPCSIETASVAHDYHDGFLIIKLQCE